jgi:type I site-specific restriction-modification system R (restriction) subunit
MRDALPNASFIDYRIPIEKATAIQGSFWHDIDIYDIEQAVKDGANSQDLLREQACQA